MAEFIMARHVQRIGALLIKLGPLPSQLCIGLDHTREADLRGYFDITTLPWRALAVLQLRLATECGRLGRWRIREYERGTRYVVVEHFRDGDAVSVYERLRAFGRMAPDGLVYVNSWVTADLRICYQVEAADRQLPET